MFVYYFGTLGSSERQCVSYFITAISFLKYFIPKVVSLPTTSGFSVGSGMQCQGNILKNGKGEEGIMVDSLEILSFSVDQDRVFVEGDIIRNKVFVGIIYFYERDRRLEAWRMLLLFVDNKHVKEVAHLMRVYHW